MIFPYLQTATLTGKVVRLLLWSFRWILVGTQLVYYCYQDHSNCPLCRTEDETVSHVLHCPDPEAVSFAAAKSSLFWPPSSLMRKLKSLLSLLLLIFFVLSDEINLFKLVHTVLISSLLSWHNKLLGETTGFLEDVLHTGKTYGLLITSLLVVDSLLINGLLSSFISSFRYAGISGSHKIIDSLGLLVL